MGRREAKEFVQGHTDTWAWDLDLGLWLLSLCASQSP